MLIALDAIFAIVRQYWIYETFSEYQEGLDSVTIVKVRSRFNSRSVMRLIWDNRGDPNRSRAQVLDEGEWAHCKYRGSKVWDHDDLTDIRVMVRNHGRILAFL